MDDRLRIPTADLLQLCPLQVCRKLEVLILKILSKFLILFIEIVVISSHLLFCRLSCTLSKYEYKHDYRGFDDSILFEIDYFLQKDVNLDDWLEDERYSIKSTKDEGYTCYIPQLKETEGKPTDQYSGPSPFELLRPLFVSDACSYRIDSYWTYEVCHGNFIKQFHEERDRMQEYYLGKFDKSKLLPKEGATPTPKEDELVKYPQKKIDGNNMAYYEVEMTDGTLCDLNNEPRTTKILYVCYAHGKNEIYSLKETSSCNYEVIILTQTLCTHPSFKGQEVDNNKIKCVAEGDAPKKPEDLYPFEIDTSLNRDLVSGRVAAVCEFCFVVSLFLCYPVLFFYIYFVFVD